MARTHKFPPYYVERNVGRASWRNWWLIKENSGSNGKYGRIDVKYICMPRDLVGKRVRLLVEVIDEPKSVAKRKAKAENEHEAKA